MKHVCLGEVATLVSGGTPPREVAEYFGAGVPWASIGDLNDSLVKETKEALTTTGIANSAAKVVPPGTVLVAMYGASIGKLGVAGSSLCTNQAIAAIQPRAEDLDSRYLYHFLLAQRKHLRARGRGGAQPNIGLGDLKKWLIPLRPLDEQRRVAEILDRANALLEMRNEVVAQFGKLAEAVFSSAFGTKLRNPTTTLGEVADIASGITKGRRTAEPTRSIPYLAVANVQAGHLNLSQVKEIEATDREIERYVLAAGDIVLTEGGDPDKLGRGTVWREELPLCLHQNHIFRVRMRDDQLDPEYLSAYLASKPAKSYFLRSAKQTTGIASINMSQLRGTPIYVPSRSEQERYSTGINEIRSLRRAALIEAASLDELFASLQSRAFAGRL